MTGSLTVARLGFAASLLGVALVTLFAGGCGRPDAPPPNLTDVTPPAAWTAPAEPLPDIPRCDQRTSQDRVACRAAYDATVRGAYVRLSERHAALAGWTRVVVARRNGA